MDYFTHSLFRPAQRTLLSFEDVAAAIPAAFAKAGWGTPTMKTVAKLIAQSSLETGFYQHMWNFNFGNVKKRWTPDDGRCFTMFRCNEVIGGKEQWFDPPHLQTHFRAFDSAALGIIDWLSLIMTAPRYAPARALLLSDAASGYDFAYKLGECGYYTATKERYSKSVDKLTESTLVKLAARAATPGPAVAPAAPLATPAKPAAATTQTSPAGTPAQVITGAPQAAAPNTDLFTDAERDAIMAQVGLTTSQAVSDFFRSSGAQAEDPATT